MSMQRWVVRTWSYPKKQGGHYGVFGPYHSESSAREFANAIQRSEGTYADVEELLDRPAVKTVYAIDWKADAGHNIPVDVIPAAPEQTQESSNATAEPKAEETASDSTSLEPAGATAIPAGENPATEMGRPNL